LTRDPLILVVDQNGNRFSLTWQDPPRSIAYVSIPARLKLAHGVRVTVPLKGDG
jgi:hypothetical protein